MRSFLINMFKEHNFIDSSNPWAKSWLLNIEAFINSTSGETYLCAAPPPPPPRKNVSPPLKIFVSLQKFKKRSCSFLAPPYSFLPPPPPPPPHLKQRWYPKYFLTFSTQSRLQFGTKKVGYFFGAPYSFLPPPPPPPPEAKVVPQIFFKHF